MKKILGKLLLLWKFLFLLFFFYIIYLVDITNSINLVSNAYTNKENKTLLLDLNGYIKEKPLLNKSYLCESIINLPLVKYKKCKEISLFFLVALIKQAKYDSRITGIVLFLDNFLGGNNVVLENLGKALHDFKKSGKFIYAVGNSYTQNQYFIASYANKIYITRNGFIELYGLHIVNLYYKDFLDKFGFKVHILRHGEYKSAVEPFLRNSMSSHVKKNNAFILQNIWDEYVNTIANNRYISNIQMHKYLDNYNNNWYKEIDNNIAQYAYKNCLVDYVLDKKEINNINDIIGIFGSDKNNKNINYISIYHYSLDNEKYVSYLNNMYQIYLQNNFLTKLIKDNNVDKDVDNINKIKDTIAIIVLNTSLFHLNKNRSTSYVEKDLMFIINSIRYASVDTNNKGLILYINSPGGDYITSKLIYDMLLYYKSFNKPIVVVMGGMAASGGYYIASVADYIYASKYTITGSIGVYSIHYTLKSIWDMLGIHEDYVSNKGYNHSFQLGDLSYQLKNIFMPFLEKNYLDFWKIVLRSRYKDINFNDIDHVTNGSIYTGYMAKKYGLIDDIGDINTAIYKVASLSKLKSFKTHWYTYKYNKFQKLLINLDIFNLFNSNNISNIYNKIKYSFGYLLVQLYTNTIKDNKKLLYDYFVNKDKYIYMLCDRCDIQNN